MKLLTFQINYYFMELNKGIAILLFNNKNVGIGNKRADAQEQKSERQISGTIQKTTP